MLYVRRRQCRSVASEPVSLGFGLMEIFVGWDLKVRLADLMDPGDALAKCSKEHLA
jgi:hypothetical protein